MIETIRQYIRNYHTYVKANPARDRQDQLLSFSVLQCPWNDLVMDFITKLLVSLDAGFSHLRHIWVIIDRLTKEQYFVPC